VAAILHDKGSMYSLVLNDYAHIYKVVSHPCADKHTMLVFFSFDGMLG